MTVPRLSLLALVCCLLPILAFAAPAADAGRETIEPIVTPVAQEMMRDHDLPGLAVGVTIGGHSRVFNYGVASLEARAPVTDATLFEIGSVSKPLTATLAAWAQEQGKLRLSAPLSECLPDTGGEFFDRTTGIHLATYTAGLPLQVPGPVTDAASLRTYLLSWKPAHAPGERRLYSNPSIGLLGLLAAEALGADFETLMQDGLLPALGMRRTFITVPEAMTADYAQGYTSKGEPIRIQDGYLLPAYGGLKATAGDLLRFLEANMLEGTGRERSRLENTGLEGTVDRRGLPAELQRAMEVTRRVHYRLNTMNQALAWEEHPWPPSLETLLAASAGEVVFTPQAAVPLSPPVNPGRKIWIHKTGSTNGFGAYVAFVPELELGIVILANRSHPVEARLRAAHRIMSELAALGSPSD